MFDEGGTNAWWVNALFWASIVLFGVAIILFGIEYTRRLKARRMTALARGTPTTAADASNVRALSPWAAAAALIAFGVYMFCANSIDERPRDEAVTLSGCPMTVGIPAEARATSSIYVEASLGDATPTPPKKTSCVSVLRSAALVVDGAPVKDDLPIVLEKKGTQTTWKRRWFIVPQSAGKHRIEVLSKDNPDSFTAAGQVDDTKSKVLGRANELEGCKTVPHLPKGASKPGATVKVDLKITCGTQPQDLVPTLFVNGNVTKLLATIDVNGTRTFRWTFARTKFPDRLDFVVTDIADDWPWPILVRQPPTLGNVQDVITGLTGVIVSLSGLLVGVVQFLRGDKVS